MKKLIITFIVMIVSACNLYSQTKIIKGRVISDDFEAMPFTSIMINDTVQVGRTDLNGFFQIDIPVSVNKILFWFAGMELAIIEFENKCDEVEVVLLSRPTYDFMTLKKVDKLRKKQFNTLPEIHKEAFAKGIFKTDKACYKQEFRPYYKKNPK